MIKSKALQLVAVALAAGVLIGAAADRAISRLDVRAMSEGEKNRQVRSDLLSILRPSKSLFTSRMLSLDGDVWMQTKAVASEYRSLCQRDMLSLYYTSIDRSGPALKWRAMPYGIASERSYRFVAAPKLSDFTALQAEGYTRSKFDSECRGADESSKGDEWTGWFTADYSEQAMLGGFAMLALQEWFKDPAHQFQSCDGDNNPQQCRERATALMGLANIGAVANCPAQSADETCLVLGQCGPTWTIRAKKTRAPMKPEDIMSVDFEEQIIVT